MAKLTWKERDAREDARILEIEGKIPEIASILGATVSRAESDKRWDFQVIGYVLTLRYDNWKDRISVYANFGKLHQFRWHGNDPECLINEYVQARIRLH